MNVDETTLRAYVDGELSVSEQGRIEAVVANNPELAQQLKALRASCLPYRAAFDTQNLPPVPTNLTNQITNLLAVAAAPSNQAAAQVNQAVASTARRHWLRSGYGLGLGLAASFAGGFLIRPLVGSATNPSLQATAPMGAWVMPIASYQSMYVRDTLDRAAESQAQTEKVLLEFQRQANKNNAIIGTGAANKLSGNTFAIKVPDLSGSNFEFKRAQLLGFGDQPLLQMAYLPKQGKPAALCILLAPVAKNQTVTTQTLEGLSVVTWQVNHLAYVLASDLPVQLANQLGEQIARNQLPTLVAV